MDDELLTVTAQLNDRAQPLDRAQLYEDPLKALLSKANLGSVAGGGTHLATNGEIVSCDLEIQLHALDENTLRLVKAALEKLGAPKGSTLRVDSEQREVPFGLNEGLAVYLNGTDLPDATYRECDSNFVYEEFNRLLQGQGSVHSHWQGPTETALYVYGSTLEGMKAALSGFINSYPLCDKARIVRIA